MAKKAVKKTTKKTVKKKAVKKSAKKKTATKMTTIEERIKFLKSLTDEEYLAIVKVAKQRGII